VEVANQDENTQRRVRPIGYARVWLDNKPYFNDNCGPITLAGGQSMWCYGTTLAIPGHNRDVFATGYVWLDGGIHDLLHSPHWKMGRTPPIQPARARIVSILYGEAANPAHNREIGAPDCNFYTGALVADRRAGCRPGFRRHAWCADFGRWVWGAAGVSTTGLSSAAISFMRYGVSRHSWHSGSSLAGIAPGDAVVMAHHVAFVTAVHGDGSVMTISGKSSNRVKAGRYRPGQVGVLGFSSPVL
jgi:hypothetical protein